jgi:hypothetical protein
VDVLEKGGEGLNLTFETRDGILKHTKGMRDLDESLTEDPPATLEGMVVRVADRIAYINHDIGRRDSGAGDPAGGPAGRLRSRPWRPTQRADQHDGRRRGGEQP